MTRTLATLMVVGCIACSSPGTVDPTKFAPVEQAAQSTRAEAQANGGEGSTRFADQLKTLQAAIGEAGSHVQGDHEKAALRIYGNAAQTYQYFLRFQTLGADTVGGMVLLRGANRPVALRYAIPFEERGGGRWVSRKTAMATFAAKADAELTEAFRLVHGAGSP